MGKVVTSQGMRDFVQSGKHETIKNDPPPPKNEPAPPLEVKKEIAPTELKEEKPDYKDDDAETQAEIDKSERFKKLIGKKHYEMKKAQAEAESADRLAEEQFNRARLAEQKLAEYDAKLKELEAKAAPKEQPKQEKPDPAKFNDDKGQFRAFEYAEALAAWSADQRLAEFVAKQESDRKAQESAIAEARARELINQTKTKYPDYDERIRSLMAEDLKTHSSVIGYISASDQIGELNYYLATNPDFIKRINAMHPLKAVAAIRDVELTFEKPEPKKPEAPKVASGAPPPITPLPTGGAVDTNTDPSKMDFRQLREYRRAQERAKRH